MNISGIKKNQNSNANKKYVYSWTQKVDTKVMDIDDTIKVGKKKRLEIPLNNIDEEKYPLNYNKINSNEAKNEDKLGDDLNNNKDEKNKMKKKMIEPDKILNRMKEANDNIVIENANFLISNRHLFPYKDKRGLNFDDENANFNFQTYKYINDKLFPQLIHTGIKNTSKGHFQKMKEISEYDPKIQRYYKELEDKIEKDIELKLSDNYYELKNKHLQSIFSNKPKEYNGNLTRQDKSSNYIKSTTNGVYEKESPSKSKSLNHDKFYNQRKPTCTLDKMKNSKNSDIRQDYERLYKDTFENIFIALDNKNINRYINAAILDKTKLDTMDLGEQYKFYFPTMNKAEQNLKKIYQEQLNKNEKDLEDTKKSSISLNDKLLANIKEIKDNLLIRLKNREKAKN